MKLHYPTGITHWCCGYMQCVVAVTDVFKRISGYNSCHNNKPTSLWNQSPACPWPHEVCTIYQILASAQNNGNCDPSYHIFPVLHVTVIIDNSSHMPLIRVNKYSWMPSIRFFWYTHYTPEQGMSNIPSFKNAISSVWYPYSHSISTPTIHVTLPWTV